MKRVVRKLIFPRGTLIFGYALVTFVCLSQVFALTVFRKINQAAATARGGWSNYDTSAYEALFLLIAPVSIWAVTKAHMGKGNGWANFLRHLPVSEQFIYRSKIKADMAVTIIPMLLASAFFLVSALVTDTFDQTPMIVWKVLSGYVAGFALFTYFHFHVKQSAFKPFLAVLSGLTPLALAFLFPYPMTYAIASVVGIGLLGYLWNQTPAQPVLACSDGGSEFADEKVDELLHGRQILRRWFSSHFWATGGIVLVLAAMIGPILGGYSWDYEGIFHPLSMEAMFVLFAAMGLSITCLKIQHLPVPKRRLFPIIALPMLAAMLTGALIKEGMNYHQIDFFPTRFEAPIQFTAGKAVEGEGTVFQVTVPPQLLRISSDPGERSHDGYPLLWKGGPALYNPYFAGEYKLLERRDLLRISEQLHRALQDYYGSAPSLEWLRAEFCNFESKKQYFRARDFEKWQAKFAAGEVDHYQTQTDFWHQQTLYLMPAKILQWVLWWGVALLFAFTIRFEHWSHRKQIFQRLTWAALAIGIFLWELVGPMLLYGTVQQDAYAKRLAMAPIQSLRAWLPENMALAWISVALVGVVIYWLALKIFRPDQWTGFESKYKQGGQAFEKWRRI